MDLNLGDLSNEEIDELRLKLRTEFDSRRTDQNVNLNEGCLGKFYLIEDQYGESDKPFYIYVRPLELTDTGQLRVIMFSTDSSDQVEIEVRTRSHSIMWREIPYDVYFHAVNDLLNRLNKRLMAPLLVPKEQG